MEVIIFIFIISLIFVAVAYMMTLSLKQTQYNKDKIIATHAAEELEEWLRGEKESDWSTFTTRSSDVGSVYCFNDSDLSWPATGSCEDSYSLNNQFKRELTLTTSGEEVSVTINVSWKDGANTFNVPIDSLFTSWE